MKKKIINGILMAAMLFAGTTSFVSCKDNVDDNIAAVYKDLDAVKAQLESKINDLDGRLTALASTVAGHTQQIADLQGEVSSIKSSISALDTRVGNVEDAQNKLTARIKAAEDAIDKLEAYVKNLIFGINVEETKDAVVGTINLPGVTPNFLMSYYGLNQSGIKEFPTTSALRHVYGDEGQLLVKEQIGGKTVQFEGRGALITQYADNVGKVYFTLNPTNVDLTGVTFDFINSQGKVYPFEISEAKKSGHLLTLAAGKHGNGIDGDASEDAVLYEASINLPISAMDDAISFNLDDTFNDLNTQEEIKNIIDNVKAAKAAGGKTAAAKSVFKEALQLLQNNYQLIYDAKSKLALQALRATWAGGDNAVTSGFNITTAAVEPLSYQLFWVLDTNTKDTVKRFVDVNDFEKAIAALAKAILKQLPNVNLSDVTIPSASIDAGSGNAYFVVTDGTGTWPANLGTTTDQNVDTYAIQKLVDAINSGNTQLQTYVNDYIHKLNKAVSKVTSADADAVLARVQNYLDRASNKLTDILGDHYFFRAVTPILLFEGAEGIDRLTPGLTLKNFDSTNTNYLTVIMTSPTEEYLVPAMYKYVAVRQGSKVVDSHLFAGTDKIASLKLPMGDCEIIYQTVDYSGWVVSKTYPVTVVE